MGVQRLKRIEGPFDQVDVAAERLNALRQFQHAPGAGVAVFGQHPEHVAMQICLRTGLDAGNGQAETHHALAVERAEGMAADFGGDDKQTQRDQFDFLEAPNHLLQSHGFLQIRQRG